MSGHVAPRRRTTPDKAVRGDPDTTFHVERINADGVACVAVKNGASVALSCNWPAAAPQWWQPQPEEPKP